MKKIYALMLGLAALVAFSACTEDDYASKYLDPSKTTTVTCEKLMTGAFMAGNQNTFNSYWRMYTWDNYFGKLAQTIGFSNNSGTVYYINDGYANDRWNNFYDILRQYRVMEKIWNEEEGDAKVQDRIFLALTEVFIYDHLSQLCDIWGPVPFTAAGNLGVTGDLVSSYPAYDSDVDLYKMMLENLDALYTEIGSLSSSISSTTQAKIAQQDYINGGDLQKWQRYCNSLMLRLGMHVALKGSLTSQGQAAVKTAAGRLLVTDLDNAIGVKADNDGFKYYENYRDGFKDINNTASQAIIDALQITGANDPRLPVIYVPDAEGNYYGMSTHETDAQQSERSGGDHNTEETRYYARLNNITYMSNNYMWNPIITASEVYFLLAEAAQRGYISTTTAEAAFKDGVKYSILAYLKSNMESSQASLFYNSSAFNDYRASEYPSDAEINAYTTAVWGAYSDKLNAIMTQKWVNFGILQPTQAWTDIRRTGLPALYYPADGADNNGYKTVTQRVKYPNTEAANNTANYEANKANVNGDSAYYTLFWATEVK